jgi:hypothetical protein
MKSEDIKKLGDEDLAALSGNVQEEVRNRQPKVYMEDIKVGMSKEESARVRDAIRRATADR